MNCQRFQEYLNPFLDGEIDEQLRFDIEVHLKNCPVCSMEIEREGKFGHLLKAHLIREKAPFALREAVIERLGTQNRSFSWRNILITQLVPSFAMIVIIGAVFFNLRPQSERAYSVFGEAASNHLEYLKGANPLEFQTSEIKKALEWFRGKTDFAVTSPHIDLSQVNLMGGRLVHLNNKKSAFLLLEKDGYEISAFYTDVHDVPSPKASDRSGIRTLGMRLVKTEKGFHTIYCFHPEDQTACILVSDMPLKELEKLIV